MQNLFTKTKKRCIIKNSRRLRLPNSIKEREETVPALYQRRVAVGWKHPTETRGLCAREIPWGNDEYRLVSCGVFRVKELEEIRCISSRVEPR